MSASYKKEYLLDLFMLYDRKHKKVPTRREMYKEFGIREDAFCRIFGSWEESKIAYKATTVAKNNELILDTYLDEDTLYQGMQGAEQAQKEIDYVFAGAQNFNILSLSDIELPYANIKMINQAVKHALEKNAEVCVLNGDITHSDFFSKHAKTSYVSPQEEYSQLEQLVAWLAARFWQVILVSGNHDRMVRRFCQRAIPQYESMQFLIKDDLLDLVASKFENVVYAKNWWGKIKDVIFMHPDSFTILPMRTVINASKIIQKQGVDATAWVQGHCFSSDTELLTPEGWKTYDSIDKGTVVATMNKETKAIEFQQVQEKFIFGSYDRLLHFESTSMDHLVTEDHGMVSESRIKGVLSYPKAKDWNYNSLVRVSGICERPDLPGWTDNELKLLVWCCTDGITTREKDWMWYFGAPLKLTTFTKLLTDMGITFSVHTSKRGCPKVYVDKLPEKFTKVLSTDFYKLSNKQANIVMDTWGMADGTIRSDSVYQLITSVKEHADLLQALAVTSGSLAIVKSTHGDSRDYYTVYIHKYIQATWYTPDDNFKGLVPYTGEVFCVSVPNGTLLARRNGKVIVTQNTHKVGEYTEGGSVFYETGCSCLPQDYYMNRGSARWENAYNIINIVDGRFSYNDSRNYKWSNYAS